MECWSCNRMSFLFVLSIILQSSSIMADDSRRELVIDVANPITLYISSGLSGSFPGSKIGAPVKAVRIRIIGLSRIHNLLRYANSMKVKVNITEPTKSLHSHKVEVCFHRNASIEVGMCPSSKWEMLAKGSLVWTISPYDSRLLDIRMPDPFLKVIEVSIEEEFKLYRLFFLTMGLLMMALAPAISECVTFYYGTAMAIGIMLVILIVLFQITFTSHHKKSA